MIDTKAIRTKILDLAFQGKLTDQRAEEGTGETLYVDIQAGKKKQVQWPDVDLKKIPSHIPDGWKWVWFLSVVDIAANLVPPEGYQDLLHIAPDNIEKGTGKLLPCRTVGEDRVTSANHLFERGQIIYSKIRPRLRKVVVAPFDGLCSADMYPLKTQLDTQYVFYYILSESFNQQVNEATSNRVLLPKINKKELQKIYIPLPPLGEQNRIARIVTDAFAQLDLIDDLQTQYANDMDTLKTKLFEAALRGKLTKQLPEDGTAEELYQQIQAEKQELVKAKKIKKAQPLLKIEDKEIPFVIPTNWKWVRWGDLSESIQYGYNAPAKPDGRIKMLRISDIQGSIVDWGSVPYCDIEEHDISDYLLQENDILFARTGGTVGKSYLVGKLTEEVIFAGYLIRTRYSKRLSPKYLKYFMESTVYWKQLQAGTIATAQPNCNGKTLSKMLFPLPPMAEQLRIVDIIDSAFALLRKETMTYKNA